MRLFVRTVVIILSVCLLVPAFCEAVDNQLSPYDKKELEKLTIEELLSIRNLISKVLSEKGYAVYRELSHGDKGDEVIKLQEALKETGYYSGNINGKYDTLTEKAVKAFQKSNGLSGTGVATQETQLILYSGDMSTKTTATPKPTVIPTPTPDPKYAEYGELDYTEYSRYPSQHYGEKVRLEGKVVQVVNSYFGDTVIRLSLLGSSDVVYIDIDNSLGLDFKILENDRLVIYAKMVGMKTYSAVWGNEVTIPHADAELVILK